MAFGDVVIKIGVVVEVENNLSLTSADALRIRAAISSDQNTKHKDIPWAFPLLPKMFRSTPKIGEAVFVITDMVNEPNAQRYYIGPIISQPQFMGYCDNETATGLLKSSDTNPMPRISNEGSTEGAFPATEDIAMIGRGSEDVALKYDNKTRKSEVLLRAGIRKEPVGVMRDIIGNCVFNNVDPSYIQLKYKNAMSQKYDTSSVVNVVSDYINLISNKDMNVTDMLHDKEDMIKDVDVEGVMDNLHQVPMGDKLVELLDIIKGCILWHVHPWAGMKQCGDKNGYINKLASFPVSSILSKYVRIS